MIPMGTNSPQGYFGVLFYKGEPWLITIVL